MDLPRHYYWIAAGWWVPSVNQWAQQLLAGIDFNKTLMHGMLGFLLFAGALHVNINDLAKQKLIISLLATVGVMVSTFMIGSLTWLALGAVGIETRFVMCLLFGALISPTDPIAVLSILKTAERAQKLRDKDRRRITIQ